MVKFPWSASKPSPPPRRRYLGFLARHLPGVTVFLLVTTLLGFVLYPYMLVTVQSGQAGVLWKRFGGPGLSCVCILPSGTVLDPGEVRNEGLRLIWPWDILFLYNMRLQISTQKFNAISSDGVSVTPEITIRYQLDHNSVSVLHQFIGPTFLDTVLKPEVASVTRSVIAHYMAQDVYSTKRQQIETEIKERTIKALIQHLDTLFQASASEQENLAQYQTSLRGAIQIFDTLVLSIELPADIVAAINRKTEQFYLIQEYQYRVQREVEESRRKQIEANGIAAFQRTVSQGVSDSFLRWQGIQATLALAQSKNAKIVIVGGGKDGLPIILGNVDTPANPVVTDKSNGTVPPTTRDDLKDPLKPGDEALTPESRLRADRSDKTDKIADNQQNAFFDLLAKLNDVLRGSDSTDKTGKTR